MRFLKTRNSWACSAFSGVLAVGLGALATLSYLRAELWLSALLGLLAGAALLATLLRLGWSVPCMVLGTFFGFIVDARPKGGPVDAQMWETVSSIIVGALIGFAIGLIADRVHPQSNGTISHDEIT